MAFLLFGCSGGSSLIPPSAPDPASILVEPPTLMLAAGRDAWLAAQANDTAGQPIGGAELRFTVADPHILQVSANGHVFALGPASRMTTVIVASGRKEVRVPVVVLAGVPYRLESVSGNGQQLRAGAANGAPLIVRVVDQWHNPVPNVELIAAPTPGFLPASRILSQEDGTARFVFPDLLHSGSFVVLLKSAQDPRLAESFQLNVAPGPAADIEALPATTTAVSSTRSIQVSLRVTDGYGNPVPGVALDVNTLRPHAQLQATTDAAGLATFLVPRAPRSRRVELTAQTAGTPPLKRSFIVPPDAPANPRTSHRQWSRAARP